MKLNMLSIFFIKYVFYLIEVFINLITAIIVGPILKSILNNFKNKPVPSLDRLFL